MKNLTYFQIAALYIGTLMGAGFASGRECWQFFGVFGNKGYFGIIFVTIGFGIFGFILSYIARSKNTTDLGKLVSPFDNQIVDKILAYVLAIIYFCLFIAMTAAGGSLLNQLFGSSKIIGGSLLAILCLITVLGNFERISSVLGYLVPILVISCIAVTFLVITADFEQSGTTKFDPSDVAPNLTVSSMVFLSNNVLGLIAISSNAALHSKSTANAYKGAATGILILGIINTGLLKALLSDMAFSAVTDLPMLGYVSRLSELLSIAYGVVLFGSIYSAGSNLLFGFSLIIPESRYRKSLISISSIIAFAVSLLGFSAIVEYMYPIQGYIGLIVLILIVLNFISEYRKNKYASNKYV